MFRNHVSLLALGAVMCSSGTFAGDAEARPVVFEKDFETEKVLGVGILVGVPLSVTGKYFLNSQWAVDVGVGTYLAFRDRTGFHVHADLLWHPFVAIEAESFLAPLYFGLGARALHYTVMDESVDHIGVRLPVGVAFDFNDQPFDVFLEAAVVFDPVVISDVNTGHLDINFGAGARYFF